MPGDNVGVTREEAQARVISALQELKAAVTSVNDSVSYLNAETGLLDQQMRELERQTALVYTPFRAALFEYAADLKVIQSADGVAA